jgi:transcriptional regulator with PAS, ATPase and Fis domain
MVEEAINVANYDCNVIIQGETGVGKEKVLQLIHKNSQRNSKPCIKVNCATIQESLAESEFFGYDPGAFTGAQTGGQKGLL